MRDTEKKWTRLLEREYTPFITSCITEEIRKRFDEYLFAMDEDGLVSFYAHENEAVEESRDFCVRQRKNFREVVSEDVSLEIRKKRDPRSGVLNLRNIWRKWKWYDEKVYTLYGEVEEFCDKAHAFQPRNLRKLEELISKAFCYYARIGDTVIPRSYAEDAVVKFYHQSAINEFGPKTAEIMKNKVRMSRESITVVPEAPFVDPYFIELDKIIEEAGKSNVFSKYVCEFEDLLDKEQDRCIGAEEKRDRYGTVSTTYLKLELARRLFGDKGIGKEIRNLAKRYAWLYTGIGIIKRQEISPEEVANQIAEHLFGCCKESQGLPCVSPEIAFKKNARDFEYSEKIRLKEINDRKNEKGFWDEILPFAEIVLISGATRFERRCVLSKLYYSTFKIFKQVLDQYSEKHHISLFEEFEEEFKRKRPKEMFKNKEEAIFRIMGFLTKNEILYMLEDLKGIRDYEYNIQFFEKRMELWVRHYPKGRDDGLVEKVGNHARKYLINVGIEEKVQEGPLKGTPAGPLWVDEKGKSKQLAGYTKIARKFSDIVNLKKNDILVTVMATPEYIPHLSKIKGLVVEDPSITSHAALMAIRYGVPLLSGVKSATRKLHDNDFIIIDGKDGNIKVLSEDEEVSVKKWRTWGVMR